MEWKKFHGEKIEFGDLLFLKKIGICFVGTSYIDRSPSTICSLSQEETIFFDNDDINKRARVENSSYIKDDGKIYHPIGRSRTKNKNYFDIILFICKVSSPFQTNVVNIKTCPNCRKEIKIEEFNDSGQIKNQRKVYEMVWSIAEDATYLKEVLPDYSQKIPKRLECTDELINFLFYKSRDFGKKKFEEGIDFKIIEEDKLKKATIIK